VTTAPPPAGPPPGVSPPPGQTWGAPAYAQPRRTNGFAIASLVLGCVFCLLFSGVLAVIFGNIALNQIAQSPDTQTGRGLAIAGIVLGWIGIALLGILAFTWLGYGISNL
jgi:hypothetical protein